MLGVAVVQEVEPPVSRNHLLTGRCHKPQARQKLLLLDNRSTTSMRPEMTAGLF